MNASIAVKIGVGFSIALIALLIISVTLYEQLLDVEDKAAWVSHTLVVESKLNQISLGLSDAEGDVRGYILTHDPGFKQQAESVMTATAENVRRGREFTSDNLVQQKNFDSLESLLLATRFDEFRDILNQRDASPSASSTVDAVNAGVATDTKVKGVISDMMDNEEMLLKTRQDAASISTKETMDTIRYGTTLAFILVGIVAWGVARSIIGPLRTMGEGASKIGQGDYAHRVQVNSTDETGRLASLFNKMAEQVQERQRILSEQDWLKGGLTRFTILFQGQSSLNAVCQILLKELAIFLETPCLVVYTRDLQMQDELAFQAGYAIETTYKHIRSGEGLLGQSYAAKQRIIVDEVPDDYLKVSSALGSSNPKQLVIQPVLYDGRVSAVLELGVFKPMTQIQLNFLNQLSETLGVILNTIQANERTAELLEQSQKLSSELEIGQTQLRQKNDDLEFQARLLRTSEMQLQEQQEELRQTNEELEQANEEMQQTNEEMEEKVNLLAEQKKEMERFNREIEEAREALEQKAQELSKASKYKSDFLANMSHELRTPLNSLLILSKMLADNAQGNLTAKQVQFSETIHSSGNDLLQLLNDILDLSKIEAGSVEMDYEEVSFQELQDFVEQSFRPIADTKALGFKISRDAALPERVRTDFRKLTQILKNLLSNAFKFTKTGEVELIISPTTTGWKIPHEVLDSSSVISFSVRDTGTGVPPEKQALIFEAFQQADAGINRQYGGTGLGLSISRELAKLLGGSLGLVSSAGEGSTFTLYLPVLDKAKTEEINPADDAEKYSRPKIVADARLLEIENDGLADDRNNLVAGDRVLLIIDDDKAFAQIMVDFAREKQFKAVVARTVGQGVAIAKSIIPSAITLDLHLPDDEGWVVLDQLKHDPKTRHIPIHIISVDQERSRKQIGVVSYFQKPVTTEQLQEVINRTLTVINRPIKNLLIVEDDSTQRDSLTQLLGDGDVQVTAVGTSAEAFAELDKKQIDCMVVDLGLPDSSGVDFLKGVQTKYGENSPPIIVYTGKELSREDETELRRISESIIIKNVRSPERLLDETALFLHRVQSRMPESERRMNQQVQKTSSLLEGRKILVVDDDVRNIFAIAAALEAVNMTVRFAESGQAGIDLLQSEPGIEIVLMDVMMPVMDGFEAIRRIRQIERFRRLPIISVTAKAMRGDREKCLEAGASDYITKPVDMEKLKSLLRVWLYK